jgi:hypothetical protein
VGFRSSLVDVSGFVVDDIAPGWVAIEPAEGAGEVFPYFLPHRLADASTDLSQPEVWEPISRHPPYDQKPQVQLPPKAQEHLARLYERDDVAAVVQRLGAAAAQADAAAMPAVLTRELPGLFERYPLGSLWYVSVDLRLLARLAFMRVRLQLTLTPDMDYDSRTRDRVQYFGMHTTTHGMEFRSTLDPVMLAVPPTALGFDLGVYPHALAFLFGAYEDLRDHKGGSLGSHFFPNLSREAGVRGMKFPAQGLSAGHWESLLAWWTTRLNVIYSHAADPTNFSDGGLHDVAAQAAWFFTLERLMADAAALLAAVDAPAILRMQAAFDLLDKADSLLSPGGKSAEGKAFKRLLRRAEALPRLERAFDQLPVQLRPRFQRWARESYDRLYDDIKATTMEKRRNKNGVRVALTDPAKPQLMSWDDYVAALMRAARNSSHGLQDMLRAPDATSSKPDRRLLLATNSGDVPSSFYEVSAIAFLGLIADAERLCTQTWW